MYVNPFYFGIGVGVALTLVGLVIVALVVGGKK
jgi:hypothetical protein